jgi:hypothetical protein
MEAVSTSGTVVSIYQITQRNIPEDSHLHTCCCENLKSHLHGGNFDTVEHYFMVSCLLCDRDCGNTEKKLKDIEVYSEDRYATLIHSSRTVKPSLS